MTREQTGIRAVIAALRAHAVEMRERAERVERLAGALEREAAQASKEDE